VKDLSDACSIPNDIEGKEGSKSKNLILHVEVVRIPDPITLEARIDRVLKKYVKLEKVKRRDYSRKIF
jgi:hypothetical protein